ncbi:reverse transcriptase domain-containing protein [Tanacetum coccineum]
MDELHGYQVTISAQWNNRQNGHKKDSCRTIHGTQNVKIPIKGGTVTIQSSRAIPMECAMISGPSTQHPVTSQVLEEKIKVAIHPEYPEQTITIGSTLTEKGRKELCALLKQNLDIFAWKPADMTGVPRHMAEHRLNVRGDAEIMKEVHYHSWLSNPVMFKKHNGSWRMCVDFKDLNKACPQEGYPLPEIDWKVESLCGYPFKCFLDAYKGYHQIKMAEEAKKRTSLARARDILLTKLPFAKILSGNLSTLSRQGIPKADQTNIQNSPANKYEAKSKKCTFEGLKVCPDKANAVLSLPSPGCLKDVQKLNGKLASLNRFLSKSTEKSLPFFKTLKKCTKKSDFQWTQEAEVAFKQMKKLIAELPMLTAPKEKEELIIYLAAAKEAISAVLMTERGGKQLPVYFVSRALRGPEVNYTPMEKLVLALLSASRRLKRYFQAHTIVVITDQPIKQLLSKSEISGRMLRWKFELEGYDIQYKPRTSIKGKILADFIVERPDEESPDELMAEPEELPKPWTCYRGFEATNNEAELEALIAGLQIAEQIGVKNLQANVDSRLVANQVNGSYVAKESGMVQYLKKVKTLASNFKEFSIKQVPQSENKKADALNKIASTSLHILSTQVFVEELKEKSIHEKEVLAIVEEEEQTWITPIYEYLTKEIIPEDKKKARVVRRKASWYTIINGTLYKKSFLGPWLRFVLPGEIVSDKGKQFRDSPFKDWCEKLCICQCFASVKHPQANGLVERANRSLGEGINARLDERSKDWIGELSHVLWAHRTMIKSSNGETPFSLTYGTEAVMPAEIGMPTLRTAELDLAKNDEALEINLDLIEEKREQAAIQEAKNKVKMEKYYNSKVRGTSFRPEDMVYRSNDASYAKDRVLRKGSLQA